MKRVDVTVMTRGDGVHGSRRRTAGGVLVGLAMAAVALSACAAGPRAQTANQYSVVDGAIGNVGSIAIRNAGVASPSTPAGYAAGATVQLSAQIVSNSINADQLLSVSTPAAQSVALAGAASSSPVAVGSPSPTPSGSGVGRSTPIDIPGNAIVTLGVSPSASVRLDGLGQPLASGQTIPVTFTFRDAGSITLRLPVKLVANNTGGETVDVSPSKG